MRHFDDGANVLKVRNIFELLVQIKHISGWWSASASRRCYLRSDILWYVRGRYADIAAWLSHHQLASISCISYRTISYLLSPLPSPAPAPAILTPISRASLVPAIALADILPRGCNHHNVGVGGNIEQQNDKCSLLTTAWTSAIIHDNMLNTLRVSVRLFTVTLVTMSELIPAQPTSDRVLIWFWYITSLFYLLSRYLQSMDHSTSIIYKFFCSYQRKYWSSFISHFSIFTQCGAAVGRY